MSGEVQDIPPYLAAAQAKEQYVFAMRVAGLVANGVIKPETFSRALIVSLPEGRLEIAGEVTDASLARWVYSHVLQALFFSAQIMNRALEDTFGSIPSLNREGPGGVRKTANQLDDREAAQEIIYMLRSAVSHDPLRPTWTCKGPRAAVFQVKELGMVFDGTRLDGKAVGDADFGGLERYLGLLSYCENKIRQAAGHPELATAPLPRAWLEELDLSAYKAPPTAAFMKFSYRIEPTGGEALLFRTRADAHPVWLRRPHGEAGIEIVEPGRLYTEIKRGVTLHLENIEYGAKG